MDKGKNDNRKSPGAIPTKSPPTTYEKKERKSVELETASTDLTNFSIVPSEPPLNFITSGGRKPLGTFPVKSSATAQRKQKEGKDGRLQLQLSAAMEKGSGAMKFPGAVPVDSSTSARKKKNGEQPMLQLASASAEDEQLKPSRTSADTQNLLKKQKHGLQLAPGESSSNAFTPIHRVSDASAETLQNTRTRPTRGNQPEQEQDTTTTQPGFVWNGGASRLEDRLGSSQSETSGSVLPVNAFLVEEGEGNEADRERIRDEVRREMLDGVVVGEATVVDDKDKDRNENQNGSRNMVAGVVVILFVIIIGVVVGVVLGKRPPPTSSRVSSPVPTSAPTPPPSSAPSSSPTVNIDNLDNRNSTEAHPMVLWQPRINTLTNGDSQLFQIDCGAAYPQRGFGLWYSYRSTVSVPATAEVCGDIASLFAFRDTGLFGCILDEIVTELTDGCSRVTWRAEEGETYLLLAALDDYATAAPTNNTIDQDFTIQVVDNDRCEFAFGPVTPNSVGVSLPYMTAQAREEDFEVPACGSASSSTGPRVWYTVKGNDKALTASTCFDQTLFDTQVSVFRGSCGDGLECVAGNDNFCGTSSSVTWPSVMDEIYYVLVHGGANNSNTGVFELVIATDADRRPNDFCGTAEELIMDNTTEFAFSGSTPDPDVPVCVYEDNRVRKRHLQSSSGMADYKYAIWYKVTGTGDAVGVVVHDSSLSPVEMMIYSGSCGGLNCADVGDMADSFIGGGVHSSGWEEQCFQTNAGETYYIFVGTSVVDGIDESHRLLFQNCTL